MEHVAGVEHERLGKLEDQIAFHIVEEELEGGVAAIGVVAGKPRLC